MSLSNKEVRWTLDRFPEEFEIRKYIFDTRRKVCQQFGYEEYLAPLVENADIYRAKSWEDVWWTELTLLTDREGNVSDIALRPEMTPSITRMITKRYTQMSKPIRYFSIANFYRNERPQRGRNREFWQLNIDLFWANTISADIEILQMWIEIMKAFNTPKDSRELYINHRKLIDYVLEQASWLTAEQKVETVRTMDKWDKLSLEAFTEILTKKWLSSTQITTITSYMQTQTLEDLVDHFPDIKDTIWYQETLQITKTLTALWYAWLFTFKPSLIRGFDYYDAMVFEMFDKHPDNNRAMFGWWRYNGLAEIFGSEDIPAVWFAPGDESMRLFLESRWLIDNFRAQHQYKDIYYLPLLNQWLVDQYKKIAQLLRGESKNVLEWLEEQKIWKALRYADKNKIKYIIIFDEQEAQANQYKIKNLETAKEEIFTL